MNVLVLGADGLLGRKTVSYLVSQGIEVIAADIKFDNLTKVNNTMCVDVCCADSLANLFTEIESSGKKLQGAVNLTYPKNSHYGASLFEVTHASFCENVSLHLGSYFEFSKLAAKYCINQGTPFSLVNTSSIYGSRAPRFDLYEGTSMTVPVEYAAIKSALIHLSQYFAAYMKGTGFRVNTISPGGIQNQQPQAFLDRYSDCCLSKGMLDTDDLMGSIRFLLSDDSKYVNGQDLIVDDGFTL